MNIGIPREIKMGEFRVSVIPEHVALLTAAGHSVFVQKDAGKKCKFPNRDYENAGAEIRDDVSDQEMIVRVKEPPLATVRKDQIILGYLHIEKGQNSALLDKLLENNVTSYAFEEIRDMRRNRLVNLGFEAGVVGTYEGLRLHGKIMEKHGMENRLKSLRPIKKYFYIEDIYKVLREAHVHDDIIVYILGKGKVSAGARTVLEYIGITPRVLYREETAQIEKFLPDADMVINAVDWYPHEPRIITKKHLRLMKKKAIIVDISCDENGAVESCIPTTWHKPTYVFKGITHHCVDNLPSAVPRDSSIHLSRMIIKHVVRVANGTILRTGLITRGGAFVFKPIEETPLLKVARG